MHGHIICSDIFLQKRKKKIAPLHIIIRIQRFYLTCVVIKCNEFCLHEHVVCSGRSLYISHVHVFFSHLRPLRLLGIQSFYVCKYN